MKNIVTFLASMLAVAALGNTYTGTFIGPLQGTSTNSAHATNADSAVVANFATNSETQGVILIYGNGTTNYFGKSPWALSNAQVAAQSGSTIQIGNGTYYGCWVSMAGTVRITGSGMATWDEVNHMFVGGGTIITNYNPNGSFNFSSSNSNSILENLSLEGVVNHQLFIGGAGGGIFTNNFNITVQNVSFGQNSPWANSELVYISGGTNTFWNDRFYDFSDGHGLILKGVTGFLGEYLYFQNCGGNSLETIFLEAYTSGNGNDIGVKLHHVTIVDGTNYATPISLGCGATNSVQQDIELSDINIYAPNPVPGGFVLSIYNTPSVANDSLTANVRIDHVKAYVPYGTCFLGLQSLLYPSLITNVFFTESSLITTNPNTYVVIPSGSVNTSNCVSYAGININGDAFSGYNFGGLPSTNTVNVIGGMKVDNLQVSGSATANSIYVTNGITTPSLNGQTAFGYHSLNNYFAGDAGNSIVSGNQNTGIGTSVMPILSGGTVNVGFGTTALFSLTTGNDNVAIGPGALYAMSVNGYSTAVGVNALPSCTANYNIGIGINAGYYLTTGQHNIDIGNQGVAGEANTMRLGDANINNTYIAGIIAGNGGVLATTADVLNSIGISNGIPSLNGSGTNTTIGYWMTNYVYSAIALAGSSNSVLIGSYNIDLNTNSAPYTNFPVGGIGNPDGPYPLLVWTNSISTNQYEITYSFVGFASGGIPVRAFCALTNGGLNLFDNTHKPFFLSASDVSPIGAWQPIFGAVGPPTGSATAVMAANVMFRPIITSGMLAPMSFDFTPDNIRTAYVFHHGLGHIPHNVLWSFVCIHYDPNLGCNPGDEMEIIYQSDGLTKWATTNDLTLSMEWYLVGQENYWTFQPQSGGVAETPSSFTNFLLHVEYQP